MWIAHHWFHSSEYQTRGGYIKTKVSVLIPFKDEKDNLPNLMASLSDQTFPKEQVEYLFINDHSSDSGESLVKSKDFTLVHSQENGKKAALELGLIKANNELIITLDADCLVEKEWLSTIVSFYEQSKADLIICPVTIFPVKTIWDRLQAIEFQSLVASTAGAALGGQPIMCNGANLAFRKSFVDGGEDVFNRKYASGDDMFLLEYAKKSKATVAYLKSRKAIAFTAPVSWETFWRQRMRWTSKSAGYRDVAVIASGVLVLLANLSLLVLPFVSPKLALLGLLLKLLVDSILLSFSASFFGTAKSLWLVLLITPLYPFYVLFSTIGCFFSKNWK